MQIIALTGGIGSGKSTVAAILRELGAPVLDLDQLAHEVRDTLARREVIDAFGAQILTSEGDFDRRKLAAIVFNDPPALKKLNAIIRPKTDAEIERRLDRCAAAGTEVVFIEIPVISQAQWLARVDAFWIVKASRAVILTRLAVRGMSEAEALPRMANQTPPELQVQKPCVMIDNDGDLPQLKARVENLWNAMHNGKEGCKS